MRYFTILLCVGFFQLGYALEEDILEELKREAAELKQELFERVDAPAEDPSSLEFLDAYTKKMQESYVYIKNADRDLYFQTQEVNSLEDKTAKGFDFGRKYAKKTIKKVKILHYHLANMQHLMRTIAHSNYLTEIKISHMGKKTLQEPFQKTLYSLSNTISDISEGLENLGENPNLDKDPSVADTYYALRVVWLVKKIKTPDYDYFLDTTGELISQIERYIQRKREV